MSEVSIPIEMLLGVLGAILSATLALNIKQSRCIGRIETEVKNVKAWASQHDALSAKKIGILDELQREWEAQRKTPV